MPIQKGLDPIVTGTMMKRLQITGLLAWYVEMSLTSKKIEEVSPLHSKWALVGYSGGSPGLENAVKRWNRPIGLICFSVYFHASP